MFFFNDFCSKKESIMREFSQRMSYGKTKF